MTLTASQVGFDSEVLQTAKTSRKGK